MKVVMCISPNKHFADLFNIKMATHAAAADVVDSHPAVDHTSTNDGKAIYSLSF